MLNRRVWKNPTIIESLVHNVSFATDEEINERLVTRYRNYDYLTGSDTANEMMLQSIIDEWANYCDQLYATTLYEYDPILNYDMKEEGEIIDELHKGSKRSFSRNYKDSVAVDRKNATAIDRKNATNMNSKDAVATNLSEVETPRVKTEELKTGYGLGSTSAGTPIEKTETEPKTGTNQKSTTGSAAQNYTEHTGLEADNYSRETAAENANYNRETAAAADNYSEHSENPAQNYETITDIDANTYDKNVRTFDGYRRYGNLGVTKTQDMIEAERKIIVDVLDVYIAKFKTCFNISPKICFEPFEDDESEV